VFSDLFVYYNAVPVLSVAHLLRFMLPSFEYIHTVGQHDHNVVRKEPS
jgi:hypothetical protein